ncbi:MAG: DUF2298 domain-containing protein, partial [Anaerolineae bacterium]
MNVKRQASNVNGERRVGRVGVGVGLALLLLVGAGLRLWNINWDRFQHVHPDERYIVWVADSISLPTDLSSALDPLRSTINPFRWPPGHGDEAGKPRSYPYGHFPLYLLVIVAHVGQTLGEWFGETTLAFPPALQPLHTVGRHLTEYNYLALVGRAISAFCDLGVLLIVYALARRIYGRGAGLLAAAAYAFAVLPIQLSHFYAVDVVLTLCVMATLAAAVRWAEGGGWGAALTAGAFFGLAVGSKFSAVLLILPLAVAAWQGGWRPVGDVRGTGDKTGRGARPCAPTARRAAISTTDAHAAAGAAGNENAPSVGGQRSAVVIFRTVRQLAAALGTAALVFLLTNPFALIEFKSYASNILAQNAMVSGLMDAPYTRQYIGTWPYWYFIQQLSQWGTGWPLGVVAWAGLIWATVRFGLQRLGRAETVLLAWALPYFALTGAFHAKFLRYMAPLLPVLLIFGAGAAMAARRWLMDRWARRGRVAWAAAATIVLLTTVGWAWAFTGVYRQEHPWLQASRWIFTYIPDGSKLLTEHWDDALPLLMDEIPGRPPRRTYERVELPLWDPDTRAKLDRLADELSRADYLILASNRLSAPIGRLPERYPMTSNYYRLLFAGELGYTPVAEFTAYPRLFGIVIRDDHADESFTVYDHPRAVIFQNTGRLSAALLRARLGRYLPQGSGLNTPPASRPAGHARYTPQPPAPDAPLTLGQPVDTLPVVADFRWNRLAGRYPLIAVCLWWLAISAMGWAAWPLLFPLLRGLPDRGHGLARAAGWLLVGWVHWMAVSVGLWQNRLAPIAIVYGGLIIAGAIAWRVQRTAFGRFWREQRRTVLVQEAVFAGAYLAFVGIRLFNPDLWQPWNGGEKFMESAFLNAILRSAHFPPYDPYFAGGILNYYYYGLYLISLPIKLTGIASEVAFNLAVPVLFALTALEVFSIGRTLGSADRRPPTVVAGALAVLLALLMGNLDPLNQLVTQLRAVLSGQVAPGFDYWASSRVIPYTINEFPFWTFLFADLHPHLIAMPFGMLVVGLAANENHTIEAHSRASLSSPYPGVFMADPHVATDATGDETGRGARPCAPTARRTALFQTGFLLLALGALGAINTWDLPTYALLVAGAFLIGGWRTGRFGGLLASAVAAALTTAAAVAAYWPFYVHYQSQIGHGEGSAVARYLGWVRAASPLSEWLTVWGILLALALSALIGLWLAVRRERPSAHSSAEADADGGRPRPGRALVALLGLIAVLLTLLALDRPTAALMALPLGLALPLAFRRTAPPGESFAVLLLALGAAVVMGIELVYLRDFLEGGDWYRMNTLFKFSVPAWLFLGLGCGALLAHDLQEPGRSFIGQIWRAALICLMAAGLLFLPLGIPARVQDRFPERQPPIGTLNGMDYMTVGVLHWPDAEHSLDLVYDYLAIRWLLDHVTGTPIIAEAPAG